MLFAAKLAGPFVFLAAVAIGIVGFDSSAEDSLPQNLAKTGLPLVSRSTPGPDPEMTPAATASRRPRVVPEKEDFSSVGPAIDALMSSQTAAEIGVAVRWSNGETLFLRNARQPFPMASVAKIYMLVAYLQRLEQENRGPTAEEAETLQAMIDISDNDSAQETWDSLGGLPAMQEYLRSIHMRPLQPPPLSEEADSRVLQHGSWGDAGQSASEMSLFLARLWQKELLSPEDTQLARSMLGSVVEEQAWGATTGVAESDPAAQVLVKNGWYPADDGWRINTAGIVVPGQGEPYVIVIFGQGFDTYNGGVATVNAIAAMINRLLLT